MPSHVQGKLPKKGDVAKLKDKLSHMGYEFSEGLSEIAIRKPGQIEAVLNELIPVWETFGWDVEKDVELAEYSEDQAIRSKYENGRIIREFPRGV